MCRRQRTEETSQSEKEGSVMHTLEKKVIFRRSLAMVFVIASAILFPFLPVSAQQSERGTIRGTVTADQGKVIGFRVAAHNLDQRLWYTVFKLCQGDMS